MIITKLVLALEEKCTYPEYPSMLQITFASVLFQPSSQTVPHLPNAYTSTRPSKASLPPTRRIYTEEGLGVDGGTLVEGVVPSVVAKRQVRDKAWYVRLWNKCVCY